ncbi:hypothetical protein CUMW_097040 [Citrus unshiu]|uniref:Uncharacterized protein n=1 Tax=Citrus unshiu TaxID=55188 RepID=A0A2H5P2V2_CITUN|nr:hypothetical protein CUMW_097040 [Citrus unshiu]
MNLDTILVHNLTLNEKDHNILPMITLKLNHLPENFVIDNIPVTTELLFEVLEDLLLLSTSFHSSAVRGDARTLCHLGQGSPLYQQRDHRKLESGCLCQPCTLLIEDLKPSKVSLEVSCAKVLQHQIKATMVDN